METGEVGGREEYFNATRINFYVPFQRGWKKDQREKKIGVRQSVTNFYDFKRGRKRCQREAKKKVSRRGRSTPILHHPCAGERKGGNGPPP